MSSVTPASVNPSSASEPIQPGLFCVEVFTPRWETMVNWYRDTFGLRVLIRVVDDQYALLAAGGSRVAIIGRESVVDPAYTSLRLIFELPQLSVPPARLHPEGFYQLELHDPDGRIVWVIAWPDGSE